MDILFDAGVPDELAALFPAPHRVQLANRTALRNLRNSDLLAAAQADYAVLITTDSNLYHQNVVARYDIAVIVLRGYRTSPEILQGAIPEALQTLGLIQPGEVYYAYADERTRQSDLRRGKGPKPKQP